MKERKSCGGRGVLYSLVIIIFGFFLVVYPWVIAQDSMLSGFSEMERKTHSDEKFDFIVSRQSVGIKNYLEADNVSNYLVKTTHRSRGVLNRQLKKYGLWHDAWIVFLGFVGCMCVFAFFVNKAQDRYLLLGLGLASASLWAWYFLLCNALMTKYTLYPIVFTLLAFGVSLSISRFRFLFPLLMLVWLLILPANPLDNLRRFFLFDWPDNLHQSESLSVKDKIENTVFAYPLAACGWRSAVWPLEYLLKPMSNFVDCYELIADSLEWDEDGQSFVWTKPVNFILIKETYVWAIDKLNSDKNKLIMDACKSQLLYSNLAYEVFQCNYESLVRTIPVDIDSPFSTNRSPNFGG